MSAGFICFILFITLSLRSLVVLFDQCLYVVVVVLASVLSFFFFVSSKPLGLGIFMLCTRKKQKKQTKCTVVGRQAVHESFIIVEAMAVGTQRVEFSWNEKHKQYILLSHSAYISQHFLKCPTITTVQSGDIFSKASYIPTKSLVKTYLSVRQDRGRSHSDLPIPLRWSSSTPAW